MLKFEEISVKSADKHNEIFNEIMEKKAHYIAWAIPGLTYSAEFCRQGLNVDSDTYKSLFGKVNSGFGLYRYREHFSEILRAVIEQEKMDEIENITIIRN